MKRLYYHPESESYFWSNPEDMTGHGDDALCVDVTDDARHRDAAFAAGARTVVCPYCGKDAVLVDSAEVYGRSYGLIYLCRPCKAWVGVHKGTEKPLGRLANKELREAKKAAHAAFDPLWRAKIRRDGCSKSQARKAGYSWLAKQLGIHFSECHIGMFDVDLCEKVIAVCRAVGRKEADPVDKRRWGEYTTQ
jgi:hypothetical protein